LNEATSIELELAPSRGCVCGDSIGSISPDGAIGAPQHISALVRASATCWDHSRTL